MSTITRERLTALSNRENVGAILGDEIAELARIALASLEAEAVITVGNDGGDALAYRRLIQTFAPGTKLYSAPPAPVSVPECFKRLLHHAYGMTMGHDWNKGTMAGHHRDKLCRAVEDCRAAMLQGADGNSPVIPDGWVLVPVEPTPEMREAYHQAQGEYEDVDGLWSPDHQWQAMLAAAPQQEA